MTSLTLPMLLHSTSCSLYLAPSSHVYQTCVCVLRPYLPAWPRGSTSDYRRGRSSNLCGGEVPLFSMHYSGPPRAGGTGGPPDLTLWIDALHAHWLPASPPDPALLRGHTGTLLVPAAWCSWRRLPVCAEFLKAVGGCLCFLQTLACF